MRKHKILFLAASPSGTPPLALQQEAAAIQAELRRSRRRKRFEVVTRCDAPGRALLDELRASCPTIVQFSGHGGLAPGGGPPPGPVAHRDVAHRDVVGNLDPPREPGLWFQDAEGCARFVSVRALVEAFGVVGSSVKLVVLNACYSEAIAEALLSHVDCVVGMAGSIRDDAARSYAIGLYGGLGNAESVEVAHRAGCAAIGLEGLADGDLPRLRARPGVDPARLVLAELREASRSLVAVRSAVSKVALKTFVILANVLMLVLFFPLQLGSWLDGMYRSLFFWLAKFLRWPIAVVLAVVLQMFLIALPIELGTRIMGCGKHASPTSQSPQTSRTTPLP